MLFAFSYSAVPDDSGNIGGVLTNAIDMTERVIEDRRGQVLRDLASRTAEARHEEEVWRGLEQIVESCGRDALAA